MSMVKSETRARLVESDIESYHSENEGEANMSSFRRMKKSNRHDRLGDAGSRPGSRPLSRANSTLSMTEEWKDLVKNNPDNEPLAKLLRNMSYGVYTLARDESEHERRKVEQSMRKVANQRIDHILRLTEQSWGTDLLNLIEGNRIAREQMELPMLPPFNRRREECSNEDFNNIKRFFDRNHNRIENRPADLNHFLNDLYSYRENYNLNDLQIITLVQTKFAGRLLQTFMNEVKKQDLAELLQQIHADYGDRISAFNEQEKFYNYRLHFKDLPAELIALRQIISLAFPDATKQEAQSKYIDKVMGQLPPQNRKMLQEDLERRRAVANRNGISPTMSTYDLDQRIISCATGVQPRARQVNMVRDDSEDRYEEEIYSRSSTRSSPRSTPRTTSKQTRMRSESKGPKNREKSPKQNDPLKRSIDTLATMMTRLVNGIETSYNKQQQKLNEITKTLGRKNVVHQVHSVSAAPPTPPPPQRRSIGQQGGQNSNPGRRFVSGGYNSGPSRGYNNGNNQRGYNQNQQGNYNDGYIRPQLIRVDSRDYKPAVDQLMDEQNVRFIGDKIKRDRFRAPESLQAQMRDIHRRNMTGGDPYTWIGDKYSLEHVRPIDFPIMRKIGTRPADITYQALKHFAGNCYACGHPGCPGKGTATCAYNGKPDAWFPCSECNSGFHLPKDCRAYVSKN